MNKSYKADVYTMGLQKVSCKHKSHASVSGVLVWYKEELQERERERERERETSGLNSTTSYLTVTDSSLTTQNFCITEALFDAANSVNPPA